MDWIDEQVFQVHARLAPERRVVMEEQGEANYGARFLGKQDLSKRPRAEQVCAQPRLVEDDRLGQALVLGEAADQAGNGRGIVNRGGTDHARLRSAKPQAAGVASILGPIARAPRHHRHGTPSAPGALTEPVASARV